MSSGESGGRDNSRHRARSSKRVARLLETALTLSLGVALLALALPRTIAAWASLDAAPAFEAFAAHNDPGAALLADAAHGLSAAVSFVPSNVNLVKLAEIEGLQASEPGIDKAMRDELLAKAERHLTEALLANPIDTFGWLDLATVRSARGASERDIVVPLVRSLEAAPNLTIMWIPRAALLLRHWQYLDIEELPEFAAQIRTIWSASPADRARLVDAAIAADEMDVVAAAVREPPATPADLLQMQAQKPLRIRPR